MTLVTGGAGKWPILDKHGKRIHVGDRIRAQICVGRLGQTRIVETTVTEAHWQYCSMSVPYRMFEGGAEQWGTIGTEYDFADKVLRCYHEHRDFEHGHETWAEIVDNRQRAVAVAERCLDAYMADDYGKSWTACASLLLDRGYTEREAEAIMRSKHMRWADDSQGRGAGKETNSAAFRRYLNAQEKRGNWRKEVEEITRETFA
jgi:hypothetical protein